jgi:hypothetical protein
MQVASKSNQQPGASVPDPPEYSNCVANKKKTAPKPAKGQPKTTDAQYKEAGVRAAARSGPAAPDVVRVDRGRGRGAGHQGQRRRGQQVLRGSEEAELPQGRRLPEVPQGLRPDRGGRQAARPARPALEQDPREGHQGQGQGHRRPDQGLLRQEQGALRSARAA